MNQPNTLFHIPPMDDLVDCFRAPMPSQAFVPDAHGLLEGWPSFHVSRADPDGGYAPHTYTIRFEVDTPVDCTLRIGCIVSTPRMPDISIDVNGHGGMVYPYPTPSEDREIKPRHALHAAIYNREDIAVFLPAALLLPGENTLSLTAVDDGPYLRVDNEQAILRLDRMADACGFHYGALSLEAANEPPAPLRTMRPGVVYLRQGGALVEKCAFVFSLGVHEESIAGEIQLQWADGSLTVPYTCEPTAFGQYRIEFLLPDGAGEVAYAVTGPAACEGTFRRRRKWHVFTTPHAHTDIGYTHRQWEVAERMSRNLDTALAQFAGENGDFFSYILDSAWSLEDFLQTRGPKAAQQVIEAARQGKLGIPANYVDLLSQFASLEDLIHNGDFTERLLTPEGLLADRVDMVDVASAPQSYPTLLAGMGVRYFLHADNQDRGPFRFNGGLHRKSPFWWEGPDGSRILTWLSRMYCELKKVCGSPGSVPAAMRGLEMWLMDYERDDYAPDAVLLYGMEADNTDIDVRMAAFQREWGEYAEYPKLIPSDGSSFFAHVLPYGDSFAVYNGDEGAYWEDGAASSFLESTQVRQAQAQLKCAETLESLYCLHAGGMRFPAEQYDATWQQVLLYDEHTWGAFLSGSDPDSLLQRDQWAIKQHMARAAHQGGLRHLSRAATRISQMWNNGGREIVAYNPYSFPLGGTVEVEFANGETITDAQGRELAWHARHVGRTQTIARVALPEIAPLAYARFPLRPIAAQHAGGGAQTVSAGPRVTLENEHYRVEVDAEAGAIRSLFDKALDRELCETGALAGRLLYATGGEGSTLLGNHAGLRTDGAHILPAMHVTARRAERTAVDTRVILAGTAPLGRVEVTFSLPHGEKRLDIAYAYEKAATNSPEAVYVDFPFALPEDTPILSDSQVGWVDWQEGVLPGACREWLPLQTSMLARAKDCDIQIASPDAFLFTVGTPVMGKWISDLPVRGGRILSYVLNNYWRCNYLGQQGGTFRFRYAITSAKSIAYADAFRFGWAHRQGLYAQRMSYQEFREDVPAVFQPEAGSPLLRTDSDHIFVNTIRGARREGAYLIRLLECDGRAGSITLTLPRRCAWQTADHLERPLGDVQPATDTLTLTLDAWQVRSLLIHPEYTGGNPS